MNALRIKHLYSNTSNYIDHTIELSGWIRTVRDNKNFGFIDFNDGSTIKNLQIIIDGKLCNFDEIIKLGVGSAITIKGMLKKSPNEKQPFELSAESITIEGTSPPEYQLQKKRHTMEFLRTISHLRPRTNTFSAVFRVRSLMSHAIHQFFQDRGFVYVHTPLLSTADGEGTGEVFRVTTLKDGETDIKEDFFGKMVGLAVTGQLHGECFAMAFRDIYTFGPTFRADKSVTTIHAAEFWMIEPEIAFADLSDNMDIAEDMLKYIIRYVMDNAMDELEFFNSFVDNTLMDRLKNVMDSEFGRITYTEAVDILTKAEKEANFEFPVFWGMDLQKEHERYLTDVVYKKPVFVTDYDKNIKAFYMRQNDDGRTVAAMDLLVPGIGELIGGSQREERYDKIVARMDELGMEKEDYWWYLELRKYGGCVHSGFGLGFERCVRYLTGMANIRDVIPFPRTYGSAEF
jgi:asparaginyl-tRNA synthetase